MNITQEIAVKLMESTNGQVFTATFIKNNGELRTINCRLGVKKHLKGGTQAYNPADYDLLTVSDMVKKQYRSIRLNTLKELTVNGGTYTVV